MLDLGWRHVWSRNLNWQFFVVESGPRQILLLSCHDRILLWFCRAATKKIVDFAMICRGCDLSGRAQARALLSRARDVWFGSLIYLFSCNLSK